MVQELVPGGDEELYSLGSYLRADGEALGLFSRPQAEAGAAGDRHVPGRRGGLGAGGRRRRPAAAARARLPRDLAGRVQARPARRALQADGGQPAPLAVARPRGGLRRRPARDRLPRPDRTSRRAGLDERLAEALGDHAACRGERPAVPRPPYVDAVFAKDDLRPGLVHAARRRCGACSRDSRAVERRARWVLDSIGAREVGFGDDVPYRRRGVGAGRAAASVLRR